MEKDYRSMFLLDKVNQAQSSQVRDHRKSRNTQPERDLKAYKTAELTDLDRSLATSDAKFYAETLSLHTEHILDQAESRIAKKRNSYVTKAF